MKCTTAAILAALAYTALATVLPNPVANSTLEGCGKCKPFTIQVSRGASDPSKGYSRNAILTNGTLPGPALHLKVGECVDFTVINNIGDDTTVHFHGIRQLATPWSDGTPGISQKAVLDGQTYTYRWLADEPGVYFYHSHYRSQMMDGLYGAIVIDAAEGTAKPYASIGNLKDLEAAEAKVETVLTSDWNQFTSTEFMDIQKAANIDDACTDSIILNGYGSVYCYTPAELAAYQRPQVPFILGNGSSLTPKGCIPPSNALIQGNYTRNLAALPAGAYDQCTPYTGQNYTYEVDKADNWAAMSFISPAGFALLVATIDGHKMYVYQLNGQYIEPQIVDQIAVTPGDRVSFFVKLDQPVGEYTIRIANDGLNQVISGFGTLKYKGSNGPGTAPAIMNIGGVSPPNSTVVLLDNAHAVPFAAPAVGQTADKTFLLDIMKDPGSPEAWQWVLNGVEPYSQANDDQTPFLYEGPQNVPVSDLVLRTNYNDWVDLIIKVAGPIAQPHPIHKHANKFYVIGSGLGDFTYDSVDAAQKAGVSFNLVNPPYLDGYTSTPAEGNATWMVFRYQANTPGAWFMHCHIQTHLAGGMAVAILDGVDVWPVLPTDPGAVCSGNGTGHHGDRPGHNGSLPIGGGEGHGHGNSSARTTATKVPGPASTASGPWGGWDDWTSIDGGATKVPNMVSTTSAESARQTGPNGGDSNYGGSDWSAWSSINAGVSSISQKGGAAKTILGGSGQDSTWTGWNSAASTTSSKPKATSSAKSSGKTSEASAMGTWSTWSSADGVSIVKAASTASPTWATWSAGNSYSGAAALLSVEATSSSWSSSAGAASATGVASYSGTGNPAGIAAYTGSASSIKAGSIIISGVFLGAVALLL